MREVWPNFFLVGAAKAGTTSAYAYLSQHSQIFFPHIKEPHFFAQLQLAGKQRLFTRYTTTRRDYLKLFAGAGRFPVIGDASPSYLWHPDAPRRIRKRAPRAKIAMLLRDPVERAHSHYLMDYREGIQHLSFYDALLQDMRRPDKGWGVSSLYFELGQYAQQVKRYFDTFDPRQIGIFFFEDLRRDAKSVLRHILRFLGLDAATVDQINTSKNHNSYAAPRSELLRRIAGAETSRFLGRIIPANAGQKIYETFFLRRARKPAIDPRARDLLCECYDPEVMELEKLLGYPLPQLRVSWTQRDSARERQNAMKNADFMDWSHPPLTFD